MCFSSIASIDCIACIACIAYCLLPNAYCLLQTKPYIHTHLYTYTQKTLFIYTHIPTDHVWATENTQYNEITFSQVWAQPNYNIWTLAHTHANNQDH